ncbi:MAG: hypothetical protein U9N62_11220 [Thermotogota bacterium]|nr:hypothetical protein [Thermotogota bacterium]
MSKNIKEIILESEKAGRIVFMTIDGLLSTDLDKFVNQPTEGILYDLNRDRATILSFIKDNPTWINNFAVMLVVIRLKERLTETERLIQDANNYLAGGGFGAKSVQHAAELFGKMK